MTNNVVQYLKSREKIRIRKLLQLKDRLSLSDYVKTQSIFSDDEFYFSSFELFLNYKDKMAQGRYFIEEWVIFYITDITIKKWLLNNQSLDNIKILIPYCGSGIVTHIVIECLFLHFKKIYSSESHNFILKKIITHHVESWDVNQQCLDITQQRIQQIFNINPVLKNTTTILENKKFDIILGTIPFGNLLSQQFKASIHSNYEDIALDFIDWGLNSLNTEGESFYFVNSILPFDKNYQQWRKQQYNSLTLHTVVEFNLYQHKDNFISLFGIGLNNKKNYTVNYYNLDKLHIKENIPVELFYQLNHNYYMNVDLTKY